MATHTISGNPGSRGHERGRGPLETTSTPTTHRGLELLEWASAELENAGISTAVGDAQIILAHTLGLTRADVQSGDADTTVLDDAQHQQLVEFVARRAAREPLQLLTGVAFFRQLRLAVGPGVFVPRRESEFVAGLAIEALRAVDSPAPIGVDLGTGAGAIALAMAVEVPHSTVYGVELYPEAYEWLRRNVGAIAPDNCRAVLSDLADALPELDGMVDVVAANPPFQPAAQAPVTPEVRLFDPPTAWLGGADGLELVRGVSTTARRLLRPGGTLALEHGISQSVAIAGLLEADGWDDIVSHTDTYGRQRVTTARWNPQEEASHLNVERPPQ